MQSDAIGTGRSWDFDDLLIAADSADLPIDAGGATVRYRNVVHERTGSTKPWTNAGAEVPL